MYIDRGLIRIVLDLLRPKWKHSDNSVRRAAIETLKDQASLAKVASVDPEYDLRLLAVRRLTDQSLLADIVKNHNYYSEIRSTALERMTDQALLAEIARDAIKKRGDRVPLAEFAEFAITKDSIGERAARKLTDQALLAEVGRGSKDWTARLVAVEKLTDQAILGDVASRDEDSHVRLPAVKKLTDQAILADVAIRDNESDVRQAAVERLTDQGALAKVAGKEGIRDIFTAAVNKINDEAALVALAITRKDSFPSMLVAKLTSTDALIEVAQNAVNETVCEHAFKMLHGLTIPTPALVSIATTASSSSVRLRALEEITDRADILEVTKNACYADSGMSAYEALTGQPTPTSMIVDIARTAKSAKVRVAAVAELQDQELLAEIAQHDVYQDVRVAALEKLTDECLFAEVAKYAESASVRRTAIKRVTDQGKLADIASNDTDKECREAAVLGLSDTSLLANVARHESDAYIRRLVVEKLNDDSVLETIARNDTEEHVRGDAIWRLTSRQPCPSHGSLRGRFRDGKAVCVECGWHPPHPFADRLWWESIQPLDIVRLTKLLESLPLTNPPIDLYRQDSKGTSKYHYQNIPVQEAVRKLIYISRSAYLTLEGCRVLATNSMGIPDPEIEWNYVSGTEYFIHAFAERESGSTFLVSSYTSSSYR